MFQVVHIKRNTGFHYMFHTARLRMPQNSAPNLYSGDSDSRIKPRIRDIPADHIGRVYGLDDGAQLTRLLEELHEALKNGRTGYRDLPLESVNVDGVKPAGLRSAVEAAILKDGRRLKFTLVVGEKASSKSFGERFRSISKHWIKSEGKSSQGAFEYQVGLKKPGFPGALIAVSKPEEKLAFEAILKTLANKAADRILHPDV
jgi:hypothetical protein